MSDRASRDRLEELFLAALELDSKERRRYTRDLTGPDADLRAELVRLLELDAKDSNPIDTPVLDRLEEHGSKQGAAERLPERVGHYAVKSILGMGGMGIVYEAAQESPSRLVALKLLRPELPGGTAQKRFEREAEILAQLQHESIAHIYEAGVAEVRWPGGASSEQPFLAMELVRGLPLNEHAAQQQLDPTQRVEIVARIAEAIEAAHSAGIVHRDLKPGNILVTPSGMPKVLDFGVARLLDSDLMSLTLKTHTGQVIGTIAYMSPEQIAGEVSRITTRSDVYSLGVLAYELLTGELPHRVGRLSIAEAARVIQHEEPTRLGTHSPKLRGDLETILGKALEKEPLRRYASAGDLASDLRRFLGNEPILARPATRVYRMRKFTRRHPGLVYGTSATMVMLVLGVVFSTIFALRAAEGRKDAEASLIIAKQQANKAEQVRAFLDRMLTAVDPDLSKGKEVTGVEIVDSAAKELAAKPPADPEVEAAIRTTLGDTYRALSKYVKAQPQIERALVLNLRVHGEQHQDTVASRQKLGRLLLEQQKLTLAEAELFKCKDYYESQGNKEVEGLALTLMYLANIQIFRHNFTQSEILTNQALRIARSLPDALELSAMCLDQLAFSRVWRGQYDGTEEIYRESLRIRKNLSDGVSTSVIETKSNIASLYESQDLDAKAEPLYEEVLEEARKLLGRESSRVATLLLRLAGVRATLGKMESAAAAARECLEITKKTMGPRNAMVADVSWTLANALASLGQKPEATRHFEVALDILEESERGNKEAAIAFVRYRLADLYLGTGKLHEAEEQAHLSFELHKKLFDTKHERARAAARILADICIKTGRPEEAAKWHKLASLDQK